MVVLNAKSPATSIEFNFETTLETGVADTLRGLLGVHNLLLCCRELAAALVADQAPEEAATPCIEAQTLLEGIAAKWAARAPLSLPELFASARQVNEVLAVLPESHSAHAILDSLRRSVAVAEQGGAGSASAEYTLWFSSKAMQPGKLLKDYLGDNEKTRAVVKLQPAGTGAPPREPVLDPDTQQAMTAYYYKKQQEQQRMAVEDGGSTDTPAWARGDQLKRHFTGMPSSIRTQ